MAYYVFIGQNASTGNPHPITGHYSAYGRHLAFRTKKERDEYYEDWYSNNPSEFIVKCSINTARKFSLGMSVRDYQDYLLSLPYGYKDDLGRWVNNY